MKIIIKEEGITSSVECNDPSLTDFREALRRLLHVVWFPEQIDDIMPSAETLNEKIAKVRKDAYDEGYAEGEAANAKSAETIYEEGKAKGYEDGKAEGHEAGYSEGYATAAAAMQETYEPLLKATAKDIERLDWLIDSGFLTHRIRQSGATPTREDIDKAMAENAAAGEGES